jgi:NADH:ubiquinone oxidoreductase subunit 5 (subunit L)/multisubunit Na+/H+ antiporter MnhA subunit
MDFLAVFIPLFPLLAALFIGIGHLFDRMSGDAGERIISNIAVLAISFSCFIALILLGADLLGMNSGSFSIGQWLGSDTFKIEVAFITTGYNTVLSTLFSVLLLIVIRFSVNYMHRETGFRRFFFNLSLFAAAMLFLVSSGNIVTTFIGWEIAGLCSYLLISYAYDRPIATINATRVFVTNRIGDAGFILGIGLSYFYAGTINWDSLNALAGQLTIPTATVIALCFATAAFAKSAQLPFTPWLARAMEGPTPSSAVFYGAVMIHAGVFLIIMLQPIFERAPLAMDALVIVGFATAVYSFTVGLTQTDVKSSYCFAISGQLGLMFLECGLGYWELAAYHLCAHAIIRCYQVLTAPSLMHNVVGNPIKTVSRDIINLRWLYIASIQRFWLDPIADRILVRPIQGLGQDLSHFDIYVIDRLMGAPASPSRAISSLAQLEQKILSTSQSDFNINQFGHGSGIAGKFFEWTAKILGWFEERLVLQGIGMDIIDIGNKLGHAANTFERLLLKPRYLVLFVFIVLLIAATR